MLRTSVKPVGRESRRQGIFSPDASTHLRLVPAVEARIFSNATRYLVNDLVTEGRVSFCSQQFDKHGPTAYGAIRRKTSLRLTP